MDEDKGRVKENKRSTVWGGARTKNRRPQDRENPKSSNQTVFFRLFHAAHFAGIVTFTMIKFGFLMISTLR